MKNKTVGLVHKARIINLVKQLEKYFLDELQSANDISIFLCGGSTSEQNRFRTELGNQISNITSKYSYSVHYPEDMFTELISGHYGKDLLTLENILANSVHCVVILLQSPGTFTELGAFTNHPELCNKLVVVIDEIHRGKRSFISQGPVRYLRTRTTSKVLYSHMDHSNLEKLTRQVVDAARDIPKYAPITNYLSSPIASSRFYLALIYVFDKLPKVFLLDVVRDLSAEEQDIINTVAHIVLNNLISRQRITLDSGNLSITDRGIDTLLYDSSTKKRSEALLLYLSKLRLEALNLTMRKYYSVIWVGR